MIAALSIVLIFAISFFLVRVSGVALRLTGLPEHNARFQAISALTGTGFTTSEAELIVNYPIRRKIIALLMLFGNLGIVSVLSTLMISFVRIDADFQSIMTQIGWIIGATIIFFAVMLNRHVDRVFCKLIGRFLEKHTFLGGRHYRRLLQISDEMSIGEHQFFSEESLTLRKVQSELGDLSILAIKRKSGETEAFSAKTTSPKTISKDITHIHPGDTLILFGPDSAHHKFKI